MAPLPSSLGVSPQELLILFAQGQSRPGPGRNNENTMKTKTNISGYILCSGAAALLLLCGVVAVSSATNPKSPVSQNNIAFGVNGRGSPSVWSGNTHVYVNGGCAPNDYTITTGTGTIVPGTDDTGSHCDDCVTLIALPFPVTFYDQTFFSVGISSNGNLQFTGANNSDWAIDCLPTAAVIELIGPYWQDLHDDDAASGQGVFTSVSGTAPNRIFNIEFRENLFGVDGPPLLDFEVRLHEDTPNFEIIYGALHGNTGDIATVGTQRDTGSHFTEFECNPNPSPSPSPGLLMDGLQLNFVYASGCQSPTPTPTPTASPISCDNYVTTTGTGSIVPGTTDTGNHCDDCATAIAFPFPATLYGYTFTTANVTCNGALYLTGTSDQTSGCLALPDPSWGRAIFPFQGSLFTSNPWNGCASYPGGTCGIYTSVTGTTPNRRFNIEWRAVDGNNPANPVNFEVVFYENIPSFFDIFYGATGDLGLNATSGVQASGAGPTTTFSCGIGTLIPGLKVTYSCPEVPPTPPTASLAASASAKNGKAVTTPRFTLKANTTYLVFVFTNSGPGDSATFSSTFSGSPAFTPIGAGSQFYNNKDYNFGRWVNGGASDSTGTITVTFAKNTHQAYLQVIKLSGNNPSTPIAQSAYASGNNTQPYTANLAAPPSSGDNEVAFLSANEDLGPGAPPATPSSMVNLIYNHAGPGSAGSYTNPTATQNTSFSGRNHHWGTIAVEINHN
jgi:hypothetical protein